MRNSGLPNFPAPGATPGGPAAANVPGGPQTPDNSGLSVVEMQGGEKLIRMEFYELALPHLLRILAQAANITIIQDQQLNDAKVTIIAPNPNFTLDQAFQILASILQSRQFALVKVGPSLYKTEPVANAVREGGLGLNVGSESDALPISAMLVTQIIPLKNLGAQDVVQQINGLLSPNCTALPLSTTNAIIVTDTMANVNKALQLIEYLEGQLADGMQAIHCRYRTAEDMVSMVQSYILSRGAGGGAGAALHPVWERGVNGQGTPGGAARPSSGGPTGSTGGEFVFSDPNTNMVFIQATPLHLQQAEDLIELLDKPMDLKDSVYIYPVQNLMAADLAALVAPTVGAQVQTVTPGGTNGNGARTGGTGTQPGRGLGTNNGVGSPGTYNPYRTSLAPPPTEVASLPKPAMEEASLPKMEVAPTAAPSTEARGGTPLELAQATQLVAPTPPLMSGPPR